MENRSLNLNSNKPILTYSLAAINVFVALIGIFVGLENLLEFGAKYNPYILQGQFWRFLTPIFLHANLVHLGVNTYSLLAIGPAVETLFGRVKFLAIYLIAGILGNIASFAFSPAISVGASGSIFGLLGALFYVGIKYKDVLEQRFMTNIVMMIALNLIYGFMHSNIDNFGHIGGLIGGLLASYSLGLGYSEKFTLKHVITFITLLLLVIGGILIGFLNPQT